MYVFQTTPDCDWYNIFYKGFRHFVLLQQQFAFYLKNKAGKKCQVRNKYSLFHLTWPLLNSIGTNWEPSAYVIISVPYSNQPAH